MTTMRAASLLLTFLVACNPYNPDLGSSPFRCGTDEPVCPDGYECVEEICERVGGDTSPDGGGDSDGAPLVCNDDSDIEPNDTTGQAFLTPIPTFDSCTYMVSLAVCPSTDKDLYSFRVETAGKNLRATITLDVGQGQLELKVLNGAGATISSGVVVDANTIAVTVPNMAIGTYYVQVSAPTDSGIENNYTLEIVTCDTAGCPAPANGCAP
jgi:hypothetical protein